MAFDKKSLLIYGGIGAVVLVGGFLYVKSQGNSGAAAPDNSAFIPPTFYSSGSSGTDATGTVDTSGATSGATATSTDDSIAQLLASTLSQAQLQSDTTKYTVDQQTKVALAGYTNNLAMTQSTNDAAVEQSLASQLGNIVKTFQGSFSNSSTTTENTNANSNSSGFFGIGGGNSNSTSSKVSSQSSEGVTGVGGVVGTIGYKNGTISLDIAQEAAKKAA